MIERGFTTTVDYVVSLTRRHTDAIGFIPRPRLEEYAQRGQIILDTENGDPCGFLVFGRGWPVLRVYQTCVQYDARRREHGFRLVRRLEQIARQSGHEAVALWCAEDLEANLFWHACGFRLAGTKPGGSRRGRQLNLWMKTLSDPLQPRLQHGGEEERRLDLLMGLREGAARGVA